MSRKKYVSLFFNNEKIAGLSTFGWGTHFFKGGKVRGNNHEVSNRQQRENITKPKPTPPIILMKVLGLIENKYALKKMCLNFRLKSAPFLLGSESEYYVH